jgi:hypothetical protein
MIIVLITHDGVPDDVIDDVDDDIIEGECELIWHWQKLEYAVSKMIIWMIMDEVIDDYCIDHG